LAEHSKLKVSLFQLPDHYKSELAKVAAKSVLNGEKKSINTCILEAIAAYIAIQDNEQQKPELKLSPVSPYTVRMTDAMKSSISRCAAQWQLKTGVPVTMNAVLNTAIETYLSKK
jgi:hypothetical protein